MAIAAVTCDTQTKCLQPLKKYQSRAKWRSLRITDILGSGDGVYGSDNAENMLTAHAQLQYLGDHKLNNIC